MRVSVCVYERERERGVLNDPTTNEPHIYIYIYTYIHIVIYHGERTSCKNGKSAKSVTWLVPPPCSSSSLGVMIFCKGSSMFSGIVKVSTCSGHVVDGSNPKRGSSDGRGGRVTATVIVLVLILRQPVVDGR